VSIASIVVGLAVLLWAAGRQIAPFFLRALADVDALGAAAPIAFIGIYVAAIVVLVPASVMTIAGGAIFGLVRGSVYSFVAAIIGSTIAFLLGRHVARRLVARQLDRMPRVAAIDRAVSAQGRRLVFLLRLSPVTPFNFLNYALGLTTITVMDFVIASAGMIPAALLYSYVGKLAGEALVLAGQTQMPRNASYYAVLAAGLVATIVAATVITRTARRALRDV